MAPGDKTDPLSTGNDTLDSTNASPFQVTAESLQNKTISNINLKTTWINER